MENGRLSAGYGKGGKRALSNFNFWIRVVFQNSLLTPELSTRQISLSRLKINFVLILLIGYVS